MPVRTPCSQVKAAQQDIQVVLRQMALRQEALRLRRLAAQMQAVLTLSPTTKTRQMAAVNINTTPRVCLQARWDVF